MFYFDFQLAQSDSNVEQDAERLFEFDWKKVV